MLVIGGFWSFLVVLGGIDGSCCLSQLFVVLGGFWRFLVFFVVVVFLGGSL